MGRSGMRAVMLLSLLHPFPLISRRPRHLRGILAFAYCPLSHFIIIVAQQLTTSLPLQKEAQLPGLLHVRVTYCTSHAKPICLACALSASRHHCVCARGYYCTHSHHQPATPRRPANTPALLLLLGLCCLLARSAAALQYPTYTQNLISPSNTIATELASPQILPPPPSPTDHLYQHIPFRP